MSHSTERLYRESGEEAYDQADKGEPAESQPKEDATATIRMHVQAATDFSEMAVLPHEALLGQLSRDGAERQRS